MEINKEDFEDYEKVRQSGITNMFDLKRVVELSKSLTKEKCIVIMEQYSGLKKKFKNSD